MRFFSILCDIFRTAAVLQCTLNTVESVGKGRYEERKYFGERSFCIKISVSINPTFKYKIDTLIDNVCSWNRKSR